jgi:dipeptidyl aminopeptidase/acylaminoacyl peptidase
LCHGGPTSFSGPDLDLAKLFWTSRGLGLLEVNYGGSAGFGRAYRERLRGQWGVVDVQDCLDGAQYLVQAGLADPGRLAIMGGSAGGFTALAALCRGQVFAAGVSRYGIGDLAALTRDSPKFESHYPDGLVAPWPQGRQIYHDRSPIHQLDRLDRPLLLLQGELDLVVPVSQAVELAAAVRRRGQTASLVVYPGEGHGFRRAETIRDQYARILEFLGQVLGFAPAPDQG